MWFYGIFKIDTLKMFCSGRFVSRKSTFLKSHGIIYIFCIVVLKLRFMKGMLPEHQLFKNKNVNKYLHNMYRYNVILINKI